MLSYIIAASDASGKVLVYQASIAIDPFIEGHLNPLLSPALSVPREGDPVHQPPGPVPSVGDAIVALREVHSHLNQSLLEVDSYSIKLLNQDSSGMDELEEVCVVFAFWEG